MESAQQARAHLFEVCNAAHKLSQRRSIAGTGGPAALAVGAGAAGGRFQRLLQLPPLLCKARQEALHILMRLCRHCQLLEAACCLGGPLAVPLCQARQHAHGVPGSRRRIQDLYNTWHRRRWGLLRRGTKRRWGGGGGLASGEQAGRQRRQNIGAAFCDNLSNERSI